MRLAPAATQPLFFSSLPLADRRRSRSLARSGNGDGSLNINEFVTAMGVMSDSAGYDGEEERFAKQIASGKTLDAGVASGSVTSSVEEARKVQIGLGSTKKEAVVQEDVEEGMEKLKESFDVFDADGSGELTSEEVMTILTRLTSDDASLSKEDAEEFIKAFDANGAPARDNNSLVEVLARKLRRCTCAHCERPESRRRRQVEREGVYRSHGCHDAGGGPRGWRPGRRGDAGRDHRGWRQDGGRRSRGQCVERGEGE